MRTKVLILVGDDVEYEIYNNDLLLALQYQTILKNEFHLQNVEIINSRRFQFKILKRRIRNIFLSGSPSPLLFIYLGHGNMTCWVPQKDNAILYKKLASWVKKYPGPIQFINATCFAETMIEEFEKFSVSRDNVGVIAAKGVSLGGFLIDQILTSWRNKQTYRAGFLGEGRKRKDGRVSIISKAVGNYSFLTQCLILPFHQLKRFYYLLTHLIKPYEHTTYFSQRWGVELDPEFNKGKLSFKEEMIRNISSYMVLSIAPEVLLENLKKDQ